MGWTDPITFAALTPLTASTLNQYVRDNLAYLKVLSDGTIFNGCQLQRVTTQSIASGTPENVVWTSQSFDVGNWWTTGSAITVPAASIVSPYTQIACLIFARIRFASNNTGNRRIRVLVNGASIGYKTVPGLDGGDDTDVDMPEVAFLSAADVVRVEAYQNSGGSLNVESATVTVLRFAPVA